MSAGTAMGAGRSPGGGGYAGVDYFRLAAALMVVAIHTAPFSQFGGTSDLLVTYCLGRVAVPFFFMVTGYFVLGAWRQGGGKNEKKALRSIKKTLFLYAAATIVYLPVNFYTGSMTKSGGEFLKMLFFDGTFYHLWYFPAVITGCLFLMLLLRRFPERTVFFVSVLLYLIGTGGDSWFGLVRRAPGMDAVYDAVFTVSSYTRNGVFFAPLFLFLGMFIRELREENAAERSAGPSAARSVGARGTARSSRYGRAAHGRHDGNVQGRRVRAYAAGLAVSTALMLAEGYFTWRLDLQRHNSMYLFLVPVMYFLFRLLLEVPGSAPVWTRDTTMLVYVIHPAVLIALRVVAKAAHLTSLLVDNALMQFVSVSAASFALAGAAVWLHSRLKQAARRDSGRKDGGNNPAGESGERGGGR